MSEYFMNWKDIKSYKEQSYGSDTFNIELLDKWLEGKEITRWNNGREYDISRILRTGRDNIGFPNYKCNIPPFIDHATLFKRTNPLKLWLVYHPYHNIEHIKDEIIDWVKAEDLEVEFYDSSKSWYSKGTTSMVVITTKD